MPRPVPRLLRAFAIGGLAVLVAGCSLLKDDDLGDGTLPQKSPVTTTAVAASPAIEVTNPGAEPRQLLRYTLTPGATTDLSITTELRIRQEGAEGRSPIEVVSPTITQKVRLTVGEGNADGTEIAVAFTGATLAPGSGLSEAEEAATNDALAPLITVTGKGNISSDGRLRSFSWTGLDGLDENVRATVEALGNQLPTLVAPLPGTAVGSGATWKATSTAVLDGVKADVTTTYTLTDQLGTAIAWTSSTTIAFTLTDAKPPTPTAPRLTAASTTGEGTGSTDLATLAATADLTATANQTIAFDVNGKVTSRDQIVTSHLVVGPGA